MIGFVEILPAEWESKWRLMMMRSTHDFQVEEDYGTSKLERQFAELASKSDLEPLLLVTQGMMRFLPSNRLTAENALNMLANVEN
ncbi:hypothetical protein N7468_007961 [Penicillium chermesinum]|uniref:Uncharacterized protein n=1 Tax=Penicillium chermesinum TaxID=63820 RepID=A0A9W9NRT4_9EURO|nr:uncharacterized protein N7468_007961 [Penicillium chermesinum]KAJ5223419.1 hypothetical protein N7468_007961 [Penicillium chermesinum]KAJ6155745.1 hypothetical protein N7470_006311 [Penicillium chermesinum]